MVNSVRVLDGRDVGSTINFLMDVQKGFSSAFMRLSISTDPHGSNLDSVRLNKSPPTTVTFTIPTFRRQYIIFPDGWSGIL